MPKDFDHFWSQLHVEDKMDALYGSVVEKCSEMKTLINSFQMYTDMQRNRIVEERNIFVQQCAAENVAIAQRNIADSNEIDALVRQLLETDDIIKASELCADLKTKVFMNERVEHEGDEVKELLERLEVRLDREQRQRAKHLIECTSRLQDMLDQKAKVLADYDPSLNELLASSKTNFKALLKESYDTIRLAAAKEIQQDIRSRQTAAQNLQEDTMRKKAQFVNDQHELQYNLAEALDRAKKTAISRPDEMRAEVSEMDRQLEEATLESEELLDTLLKGKEQLKLQAEATKEFQLRSFQTDAETMIQITKLTAQREKLQKKYDQLLEQITFRRNNYHH
uniref:Uncharacterized protein n=1 Tax=Plectus sambesii TaxID=2011161 RepID=A0A914WGJ9_9BILA